MAGVTTNYALDPTGLAQVLIETTSGQSTHYLPGLAQYGGNAWSYYLPDRLGSVRQLADPSGAVMLARSYDPFGNVLEQVGGGQSAFGYTGEQTDPTGLVYLRARYYSPYLNRFISPDTIIPNPAQSQSWNRYLYVGNNPVNRSDSSGHCIGILLGADTLICAEVVVAGAAFMAAGVYVATSPEFQNALNGVINSSSLSMLPGYGMWGPGAHSQPTEGFNLLDEDINQCYIPGSNVGRPDPWQLPPFSWDQPYFGPTTPPFPTGIGIPLPNTSYADSRPSSEIRRSIRSLEKQIAEHQRKIDQRIGFDPVSSDPVINQRAAEARLRHLQHEIEVFSQQIEALRQELVNRGETP